MSWWVVMTPMNKHGMLMHLASPLDGDAVETGPVPGFLPIARVNVEAVGLQLFSGGLTSLSFVAVGRAKEIRVLNGDQLRDALREGLFDA